MAWIELNSWSNSITRRIFITWFAATAAVILTWCWWGEW